MSDKPNIVEDNGEFKLSEESKKTIEDLRSEVESQKSCITRYSIETIALVGAIWGLVIQFGGIRTAFFFCNAILVFMLMVVIRIANHKYATINRNLGYQLHLNRLKDYASVGNPKWAKKMMAVDWEEAMCAWRFVQPAIFEKVYGNSDVGFYQAFRPYTRNPDQCRPDLYYWYETEALIADKGSYHQGKYLHNIHRFLNTVALFSLLVTWIFLLYQVIELIFTSLNIPGAVLTLRILQLAGIAAVSFLITYYCWSQIRRQNGYREILEGGLLSIQSCAVVWRVVVTCHILGSSWALSQKNQDGTNCGSYRYYTTYTSAMGVDFAGKSFNDPHNWLSQWEQCFDKPEFLAKIGEKLRNAKPQGFDRKHLKAGITVSVRNTMPKFIHVIKKQG